MCAHTFVETSLEAMLLKRLFLSEVTVYMLCCQLQITGNFQWARDQVATMQHSCVDDVLMANYSDVTDSSNLNTLVKNSVNDVVRYRCEPYDCNGHGRCVEGSCVCDRGMSLPLTLLSLSSSWSLSPFSLSQSLSSLSMSSLFCHHDCHCHDGHCHHCFVIIIVMMVIIMVIVITVLSSSLS